MDLSKIKNELNKFNKKPKEKTSYVKQPTFKAAIGKQSIRVVPSMFDKDIPFKEIKIYYNLGPHRVLASPLNWGEKDPIDEFVKKLQESGDSESWKLGQKLKAKTRYYVPVIDRNDESEVKMWNFGVKLYRELLNLADDDEIGDYTDVVEGRDIKLTTVGPDVTGTDYNETTIGPSLKVTPLSKDAKLVKEWLENQPDPLAPFKRLSYEECKAALVAHLDTGEDEETTTQPESKKLEPKDTKFEKVFEEADSEESDDDLPF